MPKDKIQQGFKVTHTGKTVHETVPVVEAHLRFPFILKLFYLVPNTTVIVCLRLLQSKFIIHEASFY